MKEVGRNESKKNYYVDLKLIFFLLEKFTIFLGKNYTGICTSIALLVVVCVWCYVCLFLSKEKKQTGSLLLWFPLRVKEKTDRAEEILKKTISFL